MRGNAGLNSRVRETFNSLPNNKIWDQSKFKAFPDGILNATHKLNFFRRRVENIIGKGKNNGIEHFLFFPQWFKGVLFFNSLPNDKILDWSKLKAFADDKLK